MGNGRRRRTTTLPAGLCRANYLRCSLKDDLFQELTNIQSSDFLSNELAVSHVSQIDDKLSGLLFSTRQTNDDIW